MTAAARSKVKEMRNAKAVGALLFGLVAFGLLAAGAVAARYDDELGLRAFVVVPAVALSALVSIALGRRARFDFQRTLGRIGGHGLAVVARSLSVIALLVSLTAGLALGVFAVLTLVLS